MTSLLISAVLLSAVVWTAVVWRSRRDLLLPSVGLLFLLPVAVGLLTSVAAGKVALATASVAALPALLVSRRHRPESVPGLPPDVRRHPLLPFAALYLCAGAYGLCLGALNGNDLVLAIGQTWTAALFVIGFALVGPLLAHRRTETFWLWFGAAVLVLTLPELFQLATRIGDAHLVRIVGPTAFFLPICVLLSIGVAWSRRTYVGLALAGVFLVLTVLTFTRSYWVGLAVGLLLMAPTAIRSGASRWRQGWGVHGGRRIALVAAIGALGVSAAATSPIPGLVSERLTTGSSKDLSLEVRSFELDAAWSQVVEDPFVGAGSGGTFTSMYQVGDTRVAFGPTNFVHNAYLYFPLKFGILGFGCLFALLLALGTLIIRLLRVGRAPLVLDNCLAAAFVGMLAASLTAPNLVDPRYSVFAGSIAFLAGARHTVPASIPEGRRIVETDVRGPLIPSLNGSAGLRKTEV